MEQSPRQNIDKSALMKRYYKPNFSVMFNKIKEIRAPVKNDIILSLLDGQWHSETEIVRISKRQQYNYMGVVLLGTMIASINKMLNNDYVEKQFLNGEMYYKLSDNYVGLTRACYKYRLNIE